jgi:hypothetical protein
MKLFGIMGNSISLEEELINLRMTSKAMQRSAKKCEKNEKSAVDKLKKVSLYKLLLPVIGLWHEPNYLTRGILSLYIRQLNKGIQREPEFMHKMQYEKRIR